VAEEFGDHPEAAVARMCWARRMVAEVYVWDEAYERHHWAVPHRHAS
jgi:hypothetical protein